MLSRSDDVGGGPVLPLPAHFSTTGKPALFHANHPPSSALAFFHPARRSSRATRALVASSFQVQYSTSVP
jgi:hypothetical protein